MRKVQAIPYAFLPSRNRKSNNKKIRHKKNNLCLVIMWGSSHETGQYQS